MKNTTRIGRGIEKMASFEEINSVLAYLISNPWTIVWIILGWILFNIGVAITLYYYKDKLNFMGIVKASIWISIYFVTFLFILAMTTII